MGLARRGSNPSPPLPSPSPSQLWVPLLAAEDGAPQLRLVAEEDTAVSIDVADDEEGDLFDRQRGLISVWYI